MINLEDAIFQLVSWGHSLKITRYRDGIVEASCFSREEGKIYFGTAGGDDLKGAIAQLHHHVFELGDHV